MTYFNNIYELATYLGLTTKKLGYITYRIPIEQKYDQFLIKKRNGKTRSIYSPKYPLKHYQLKIKSILDFIYKPTTICHSYCEGRSIITNAQIHAKKKWVLKIDLEDFFQTIHFGRVKGALESQPFNFEPMAAQYIAHLCTYKSFLPQGAPTSPTISNIICKSMDLQLLNLAIKYKCDVTRYADDIVFSTSLDRFPSELASQSATGITLGDELINLINSNGFRINDSKSSLKNKSERHLVTGIIVNKKPNVTKEFYRSLRTLIYNYTNKSPLIAQDQFNSKLNSKHRPNSKIPNVENVITGKLVFLRSIIGHDNERYRKLARAFARKNRSFRLNLNTSYRASQREIVLNCEGKTDPILFKKFLQQWQSLGKNTDLNILFERSFGLGGDKELLDKLKRSAGMRTSRLTIFIFDSDTPSTLKELGHNTSSWKKWSDDIYSLILPRPPHLDPKYDRYCIEMLLSLNELKQYSINSRRFYFFDEFDILGNSKEDRNVTTTRKITNINFSTHPILYDQDVLSWHDDCFGNLIKFSAALSKSEFASEVDLSHFSQESLRGTQPTFNAIREILQDYLDT